MKCEQNLRHHDEYEASYSGATEWLGRAQEKYESCVEFGSGRGDLQAKQAAVQVQRRGD